MVRQQRSRLRCEQQWPRPHYKPVHFESSRAACERQQAAERLRGPDSPNTRIMNLTEMVIYADLDIHQTFSCPHLFAHDSGWCLPKLQHSLFTTLNRPCLSWMDDYIYSKYYRKCLCCCLLFIYFPPAARSRPTRGGNARPLVDPPRHDLCAGYEVTCREQWWGPERLHWCLTLHSLSVMCSLINSSNEAGSLSTLVGFSGRLKQQTRLFCLFCLRSRWLEDFNSCCWTRGWFQQL